MGTPIYLRYQNADGTWSPYYVTNVHEQLAQDGGTLRPESNRDYPRNWHGAFAFDLSGTDFDVDQHGVQLSLGPNGVGTHSETGLPMTIVRQNPGGDAGFLDANMRMGAFEFNQNTNSMSHVGIKAYLAGPTGALKTNLRESTTGSVNNPPVGSISGNAWWDAMLQEHYTYGETFNSAQDRRAPGVRIFAAAPIDDAAHAAIEGWRDQGSPGQWPEDRIALTHNYVTQNPEQFEIVWTTTNVAGEYVIDAGWNSQQLNNAYMWAETADGEIIPGMNAAYTIPEFRTPNGYYGQDWAGPEWDNNHMTRGINGQIVHGNHLSWDKHQNISFALSQNQLLPGSATDADNWQGDYTPGSGAAGEVIVVNAPTFDDLRTDTVETGPAPEGTSFTITNHELPAGATVTVNADGSISVVTLPTTPAGTYTVTVDVRYPDGTSENVTVTITIGEPGGSDRWEPDYSKGEGPAGGTITVDAPSFDDVTTPEVETGSAPEGTGFEIVGDTLPDGSTVEIDPGTGAITITTPRDVAPGDYEVTVRITYPDGTTEDKQVTVTVGDPTPTDAENNDPSYNDISVEQGGDITIDPPTNPDGSNVPDGTEFTVKDGAPLPPGLILNEDGSLTGTLDPSVQPGNYPINIVVTYPDGSIDETGLTISVVDPVDNFQEPIPEVDMGRCVATAVGFGLPLLALIPLGLATQINIPGATVLVDQIDAWFVATNNQLQIDAGLFDGEAAQYAVRFNATLREWAPYFAEVATGVAIVAMGLLAGTMIYDACTPDDPLGGTSSIYGSSGNTYGPDGVETNDSSSGSSGSSGSSESSESPGSSGSSDAPGEPDTGEVPPTQ